VSRLAVFGYASLVSRVSAGETLGREVQACPPARLRGWRRRWSQARDNHRAEKTFARASDRSLPDFVLGLNVVPGGEPDEAPNGVLIELTNEELDRLAIREIRYRRVDVTDAIDAPGRERFDRIVTFTAKPENHAPTPPPGAVILRPYAEAVENAFAELGPDHHRLYLETTGPPPVEAIDAILVRDEIPPGNPRAW
jgi:cation transport regulator ChaC